MPAGPMASPVDAALAAVFRWNESLRCAVNLDPLQGPSGAGACPAGSRERALSLQEIARQLVKSPDFAQALIVVASLSAVVRATIEVLKLNDTVPVAFLCILGVRDALHAPASFESVVHAFSACSALPATDYEALHAHLRERSSMNVVKAENPQEEASSAWALVTRELRHLIRIFGDSFLTSWEKYGQRRARDYAGSWGSASHVVVAQPLEYSTKFWEILAAPVGLASAAEDVVAEEDFKSPNAADRDGTPERAERAQNAEIEGSTAEASDVGGYASRISSIEIRELRANIEEEVFAMSKILTSIASNAGSISDLEPELFGVANIIADSLGDRGGVANWLEGSWGTSRGYFGVNLKNGAHAPNAYPGRNKHLTLPAIYRKLPPDRQTANDVQEEEKECIETIRQRIEERLTSAKKVTPAMLEKSIPFGDLALRVIVCEAVRVDPVQGLQYLSVNFLIMLSDLCYRHGIALVFDEALTTCFRNGRTFFAFQDFIDVAERRGEKVIVHGILVGKALTPSFLVVRKLANNIDPWEWTFNKFGRKQNVTFSSSKLLRFHNENITVQPYRLALVQTLDLLRAVRACDTQRSTLEKLSVEMKTRFSRALESTRQNEEEFPDPHTYSNMNDREFERKMKVESAGFLFAMPSRLARAKGMPFASVVGTRPGPPAYHRVQVPINVDITEVDRVLFPPLAEESPQRPVAPLPFPRVTDGLLMTHGPVWNFPQLAPAALPPSFDVSEMDVGI